MKFGLAAAAIVAMVAGSIPAQAAILMGTVTGGTVLSQSGGSSFIKLPTTPGFTVGQNNFNTNNLYGFDELQNVTLTAALAADFGLTSIAAGTKISSHIIFFDPLALQTAQGTISFDAPVLAAITRDAKLIASNFLGAPTVTYLTPSAFGLEPGIDFVSPGSPTATDLRVNFLSADSPGDLFRVITAASTSGAVPEPTTWAYLIGGFGFVGAALRRRQRPAKLVAA